MPRRHTSSMYIGTLPDLRDPRFALTRLLNTSAARATPSLRKRNELRKQSIGVDNQRLYLVCFEHRETKEIFVKIGITAYSLEDRFFLDQEQYEIIVLAESSAIRTNIQIRKIEKEIHNLFGRYSYRPTATLKSGGNTECYQHIPPIIEKMKKLVKLH